MLGGSTPQTSVPHCDLMKVVDQVATACKARGILGHLSIDFLTFIDPASVSMEVVKGLTTRHNYYASYRWIRCCGV